MSNRAYTDNKYTNPDHYHSGHLIVNTEHGAAVLYQLVGGQARVVGLGHGVGHCVTGDHRPGREDPDIRYGGLMSDDHQM